MTKHEVSVVLVVASDAEYSTVFPMQANLSLILELVDPTIMADKYANIPAYTGWYFTSTFHKEPTTSLNPSLVKLPKLCVVCITGGGRGLGEEYALAFAKAGASGIILASRSENELAAVATRLKSIRNTIKVSTVRCDITSEKDVEDLTRVILEDHDGRCDILINNAAYLDHGWQPMTAVEPDDFRRAMDVNVFGTWLVTRALIPIILKSPTGLKTVIIITSMSSHVARPSISMGMSKLALNRFVEYLAGAYAEESLMSYALHPGGYVFTSQPLI